MSGIFDLAEFHRYRIDNATPWQGIIVAGDYANGNLYQVNLNTLTEAGLQRRWLRTWRALPQPVNEPLSFHSLEIDMETGNKAIDPSLNPQVSLRWSDDGGNTWSNEKVWSAGEVGQTAKRIIFRRLGGTRRNSGLDRIFELSSADPFPAVIVGADLDAS